MFIGKVIGIPIGIDKNTLDRDYGFYASVLMDIDLSRPQLNQIFVEEEDGRGFVQKVELFELPTFCTHCKL